PSYRASYCASTTPRHPRPRLSPYTTLSRSIAGANRALGLRHGSCTAPRPAVGGRATDRGASADVVRASDDVHELGACARIGAEVAEQLARDHRDALLADAPRRHALVDAFDDDADALRLQHVLNAMRDLRRHRLLDLKPAGEGFDDAGELADADDLSVRKIADVHLAGDRRHVMLAVRLEADVAQHDHLVVAVDLVERAAQELDRVVFVAA